MPTGEYLLSDPHDGTLLAVERFRCAAGPVGWRYVATRHLPGTAGSTGGVVGRVDVTVDARWRQLRVEIATGGWLVRGGLTAAGFAWVRRPEDGTGEIEEHTEAVFGLAAASPALLVTAARYAALAPQGQADLRLVALTPPGLAATTVRQRWRLDGRTTHRSDDTEIMVDDFTVLDLDQGSGGAVHLAGDVVLAAPGVDLAELEEPA
ncbi:MAG: hypothetical protein QOC93_3405 [Actinomycetota bacterium]|jgi:hypothetical protein|nr:hypothetical protein [Cryptosporangiaceae bacterium]MDQ1678261.1 hypothetical protein [Actinomycetota bacterium]